MALLPLTAGSLTLAFDTDLGSLRYLHWGETEALRGIVVAVRDADWNTLPFRIEVVQLQQTDQAFSLTLHAHGLGADPPFQWQGQIVGSPTGQLTYHFRGTALRTFLRNRIGLCILHPTENCSGQACRIEHVDGSFTQGSFPRLVSPHQPFKNIRSITHRVSPTMELQATLLGDTFEMEDQRNWTDASFKTYSTPLALPFPVEVPQGAVIEQSVEIEVVGSPSSAGCHPASQDEAAVPWNIDWRESFARPKLGFLLNSQDGPVPAAVRERLQSLRPDHLRVDLQLGQSQWRETLQLASDMARTASVRLELALLVDPPYAARLDELLVELLAERPPVARVLLLSPSAKVTPSDLLRAAQVSFAALDKDLQLVVGTAAYFAELNRDRPMIDDGSPVCYSINPQVHAFDKLSIIETLAAQASIVDTAVEIFSTDVVISPITLRPRFNPNATTQLDQHMQLTASIDERQSTEFAAAWTAGLLASLGTHQRVRSLTLFETHGPRGVMADNGEPYPLSSLLAFVLKCHSFFPITPMKPLQAIGFGAQQRDQSRHVIMGNPGDRPRAAVIRDETGSVLRLELPPESVQIIPWESSDDA